MKFNWTRFALVLICFSVVFLCACSPSEGELINELIPVIGGIVAIAVSAFSAIDPPLAIPVTAAGTLIQNGLKALANLVSGYQSNPTDSGLEQVVAGFTDVHNNLTSLLAAAQVKDPATQAKITAGVTAATQSLALLEASIVGKHPQTVATAQSQAAQTP